MAIGVDGLCFVIDCGFCDYGCGSKRRKLGDDFDRNKHVKEGMDGLDSDSRILGPRWCCP